MYLQSIFCVINVHRYDSRGNFERAVNPHEDPRAALTEVTPNGPDDYRRKRKWPSELLRKHDRKRDTLSVDGSRELERN